MDDDNNNQPTNQPDATGDGFNDAVTPVDDTAPTDDSATEPAENVTSEPTESITPTVPAPPDTAAPTSVTPQRTVSGGDFSINKDSAPKPKSNKKLIGLIIAGVVALVLIVAAVWYFAFYQNKDRIVTDAIASVISAQTLGLGGDLTIESDNFKMTMKFDSASDGANSQAKVDVNIVSDTSSLNVDLGLTGEVIVAESGDMYLKINGLREMVSSAFGSVNMATLGADFDQIISEIDDQWLLITSDDINSLASTGGIQLPEQCSDLADRYGNDKTVRDELIKVYKAHRFVTVGDKVGDESGSVGYKVSFDREIAKEFADAMKDTTIFTELSDCGYGLDNYFSNSYGANNDDTDADVIPEIEIWAKKFGHQLTAFRFSAKQDDFSGVLNINSGIDVAVDVVIPTNAKPIGEVLEKLSGLLGGQLSGANYNSIYDYDYDYDYTIDPNYDESEIGFDEDDYNYELDWYEN
ncbi:MAG: hypothetical protein LBK50_01405 [Candidatus Nomurabacteria bacterium]|jgi:hypothetical protein|nr:hypothetical protein [Candidatus Nomurabacteria bacterium]